MEFSGEETTAVFEQVLALDPPWYVHQVNFDETVPNTVFVTLEFPRGSRFACGACGMDGCPSYDSTLKPWRHLDFFQYRCFLQAYSPRVSCPNCGVRQAAVPWARPRQRCTHGFESYVVALANELPSHRAVSRIVGEQDTRVRRIVMSATQARGERKP